MYKKVMKKFLAILWPIAFVAFDILPKWWQERLAWRHCSIACQFVKKYQRPDSTFVYLVKIHDPSSGQSKGHFMNVDSNTGEFFDLYYTRIQGKEIGQRVSMGEYLPPEYVVIAFANEFSEFGFVNLEQMIDETAELNAWLWKTRR